MKMHNFMCASHECTDPSSATYRVFFSSSFARVNTCTAKPFLSDHLKIDKTKILSSMNVDSIAECSSLCIVHLLLFRYDIIHCKKNLYKKFTFHLYALSI